MLRTPEELRRELNKQCRHAEDTFQRLQDALDAGEGMLGLDYVAGQARRLRAIAWYIEEITRVYKKRHQVRSI